METVSVSGGECSSLKLLLHEPPAFIHQHLLGIYIESLLFKHMLIGYIQSQFAF